MSFIGNMLGIGKGGNYAPAAPTNILNPVTQAQTGKAYDQSQQGLAQQQAFLQALQGQNGIANQSSVFNQLQGVANGTGPNPAQAMLAQSTGQNVANQGALMASQRGAGANPALIAREAAQQGAATQQQAAGQGATLQANQSLNALNQLGGIAGQQVGQQANAANAYTQGALGQQGQLLGGANAQNQVNAGTQQNINNVNAGLAQQQGQGIGGLLGGIGSAASALGVPGAIGGLMGGGGSAAGAGLAGSVGTGATDLLSSAAPFALMAAEGGQISSIGKENYKGKSKAFAHLCGGGTMMAHGGKVPALVSPGEKYLSPKEVKKVAEGKKDAIKAGEKIPGKPKVGGSKNSYANDTVHKTLEEGGIVLPRSVTQAKNPAKAAHAFVAAIVARGGHKR